MPKNRPPPSRWLHPCRLLCSPASNLSVRATSGKNRGRQQELHPQGLLEIFEVFPMRQIGRVSATLCKFHQSPEPQKTSLLCGEKRRVSSGTKDQQSAPRKNDYESRPQFHNSPFSGSAGRKQP